MDCRVKPGNDKVEAARLAHRRKRALAVAGAAKQKAKPI
jgi:hypothetical protein